MEIIFIGTGSGSVSLERYHSALLIKKDSQAHLIDCGDGISRALLGSGTDYNDIQSILLTHFHSDHLNGLSSLITQMKMNKRTAALNIYVHDNLADKLREMLQINYIIEERVDFEIIINCFSTEEAFSLMDDLTVVARENTHLKKYSGHIDDPKLLVSLSFLIASEGKRLFFTSDVGDKEDLYIFKDKSFEYMISESTHVTPEEIMESFEILKPQKLWLTHINTQEQAKLDEWYNSLDEEKRSVITFATDGLKVTL